MPYVYAHVLENSTTPFYIGVGSDTTYSRAYTRIGRTKDWEEIAANNDFKVFILRDNLTWEEACKKENELIQSYGRINNNTGPLVNKNNGGKARILKDEQKSVLNLRISIDVKNYLQNKAGELDTTVSMLACKILNDYYAKDKNTIENKQARTTVKSSSSKGNNTKGRP